MPIGSVIPGILENCPKFEKEITPPPPLAAWNSTHST